MLEHIRPLVRRAFLIEWEMNWVARSKPIPNPTDIVINLYRDKIDDHGKITLKVLKNR